MKKNFKKFIAFVLVVLMSLTHISAIFAASGKMAWLPGFYYDAQSSGGHIGQMSKLTMDGEDVFCLEPTKLFFDGEYTPSNINTELSLDVQEEIELIHHYGYVLNGKGDKNRAYTQIAIWEVLGASSIKIGSSFGANNLRSDYENWLSNVKSRINKFLNVPSWDKSSISAKVGDTISLDGEGKIEGSYVVKYNGHDISTDNGKIIIKVTDKSQNGNIEFKKNPPQYDKTKGVSLVFKKSGSQKVGQIKFAVDPPNFSINLNLGEDGKEPTKARVRKVNTKGESISGAIFEFSYSQDFSTKWEYTTKDDGYTDYDTWNEIGKTVYVREKFVPAPYVKTDEVKTFIVGAKETTITFVNDVDDPLKDFPKGSFDLLYLRLKKTDTNGELLDGAVFEGSFDKTFSISEAVAEHTIKNYGKTEYVNLRGMKLPDIIYNFWSEESDSMSFLGLENGRTGYEKMKKKNPSLPDIKFDKYYIREKQAPVGFKLNKDKIIEFDLSKPTKKEKFKRSNIIGPDKEKSKIEYEYYFDKMFENEPIKNLLKIEKVGEKLTSTKAEEVTLQGKKYTVKKPVLSEGQLFGAEFEISKENVKKELDISDDESRLELDEGEYIVKEIKAPEGYILSPEEHKLLIKDDRFKDWIKISKEVSEMKEKMDNNVLDELKLSAEYIKLLAKKEEIRKQVSIFTTDNLLKTKIGNDRKKIEISVSKSFEKKNSQLSSPEENRGITSTVPQNKLWAVFGLFSDEKTEYYNKDDLIEVIEVFEGKDVAFSHNLIGKYYVKELATSKDYIVDEKLHKIDGVNKFTHKLEITNKLERGNIEVIKYDEDSKTKLANAEFDFFKEDGTKIGVYKTNEEGKLLISNLDFGKYYLIETKAPDGLIKV